MKTITITHTDLYDACFEATNFYGNDSLINFSYVKVIVIENNVYDLCIDVKIRFCDEEKQYHEIDFNHIALFEDSEPVNFRLKTGINYEDYKLNLVEAEKFCLWRLNELLGVNEDVL